MSTQKFPLIAVLIVLILTSLFAKVFLTSRYEIEKADLLFEQSQWDESLIRYDHALRWRLPFIDSQEYPAKKMWAIAETFERAGAWQKAIDAYRLLRSGFYSTRGLGIPGPDWIDQCNEKIAILMIKGPGAFPRDSEMFAEKKQIALEQLTRPKPPYLAGTLAAELGFLGWTSCVLIFIFKAISPEGKIVTKKKYIYVIAFSLSYISWLWGLTAA
ncbi:MAG: hypothetical protein COV66_09580 [Nitrospinae bacterium CG11_big_fil_rev_8_21_14_0_20_45_15]|nr:MAG: hypothetical protein COV66_09580 [Nitrospinae bacterium CG11_big_fil_rev_8_21_14_0_20_45_15]